MISNAIDKIVRCCELLSAIEKFIRITRVFLKKEVFSYSFFDNICRLGMPQCSWTRLLPRWYVKIACCCSGLKKTLISYWLEIVWECSSSCKSV